MEYDDVRTRPLYDREHYRIVDPAIHCVKCEKAVDLYSVDENELHWCKKCWDKKIS